MSSFLGFTDLARPLTATQQVRLELRARPGRYLSAPELVALTGLSRLQVHDAIYVLTKQHKIMRRVPAALVDRNAHQAYAWDYRGIN